jgi:phage baseplate assembly protein V
MVRFGLVSEMGEDENLGYARVHLDDVDMVSDWLALPSISTKIAKQWIPVEINSRVAVVTDNKTEQGFISVVFYNDTDTPPTWATADTIGMLFADGAEIYYDSKAHTLIVNAPESELNFKCKKLNIEGDVSITGEMNIEGDTSVTGEITAGLLHTKLTQHTHTTPAGPSGPPMP